MNTTGSHNRIATLAVLIMAALAAVVFRLAHLQLVQRSDLLSKARQQQVRRVDVPARRGTLYDRHGKVLAESLRSEDIFVSRRMLNTSERSRLLRHAPKILRISKKTLKSKLRSGRSFFLKRKAPLDQAKALRRVRLASVSFFPHFNRVYPQGRLASHVLGFSNIDGKGMEGVEATYQKDLAGEPGKKEIALDARGRQLVSERVWIQRPKEGANLTLTIDSRFQHLAERELKKAWLKYRAISASMVVMDPSNGEILALANYPNFDPNHPGIFSADERRNRAVMDAFEPGSTFKGVTAALALEARVVEPDELIDCQHGKAEFLGRVVRDHEDHLGKIPFSEVIAQSSNIGTVDVAVRLGKEKFFKGIKRFGYGETTGVDLPGESKGRLSDIKKWSQVSLAALSFGQEMSCNALRVATTYATFANGGMDVVPHVLLKGKRPRGGSVKRRTRREPKGRLVGRRVLAKLVPMLEAVVDHGSGTPVAFPGYTVAGKTGTSQKYDVKRGRYWMHKNYASFVGFVPSNDPKLVAVVVLDEPRGLTLGGWTSGPVFREALSGMVALMDLPPLREDGLIVAQAGVRQIPGAKKDPRRPIKARQASEIAWVTVPDLQGVKHRDAKSTIKETGLRFRQIGRGSVVRGQFPKAGELVRLNSSVRALMGKKITLAELASVKGAK